MPFRISRVKDQIIYLRRIPNEEYEKIQKYEEPPKENSSDENKNKKEKP